MKSQRPGNKLMLKLNKETVANLNLREMVQARGGEGLQAQEAVRVAETDPAVCQVAATPVPTDMGIAPAHP